ncbi:MAG TPA: protocatechuate 3,4-dioxygenase subunit alpha [Brevibacterium sp.]|nr:protocatechuate 3,4-dioxygenase subunit alpha [Brevibacterium sp.]
MSDLLGLTPSQTVGPFLAIGLNWGPDGELVVPTDTPGSFLITGTVRDGAGEPVPDALIETWQADPDGRFDHRDDPRGARASSVPGFRGFARSSTNDDGIWRVRTVRPGPLPAADIEGRSGAQEAPHLNVSVLARGLLDRLVTRIYFPGEPLNETDPVLQAVPVGRRETLVAVPDGDGFRFDIRLQGDAETVFLLV